MAGHLLKSLLQRSKKNTDDSPVYHLLCMWVDHFSLGGEKSAKYLGDAVIKEVTCRHACLGHPNCGLALALFMLSIEHPQVVSKFPKYEQKYGELMAEVLQLDAAGNFEMLNNFFNLINPGIELSSPFPLLAGC